MSRRVTRLRWTMAALCFALPMLANAAPASPAAARKAPAASEAGTGLSSAAETVYQGAKSRILQIRTLLDSAGRQSSLGSGFLVTSDGLAVTNYHVISQYALEPKTYRLEYAAPDGSKGSLKLLAIDVAHDLAIVRVENKPASDAWPAFEFDPRALADALPKGERIYAMGNPLDIGFTIVEGTYNGLVDKSFDERIHLSGAINPGMSGGPVTNAEGRVVGVNVAKRTDAEQVGFLVPAKFAARLLERARKEPPLDVSKTRVEIGKQLLAWQGGLVQAIEEQGFRSARKGPYSVQESNARWINCWANTNATAQPKPRHVQHATFCDSQTGLFVSNSIYTGRISMNYVWYRATDLNAFQFAKLLSQPAYSANNFFGMRGGRRMTEQQCTHDFLAGSDNRPVLRATWCARAYREYEGLYDITVIALTQDQNREALRAQLNMQGVDWAGAQRLGKRFLEGLQWAR